MHWYRQTPFILILALVLGLLTGGLGVPGLTDIAKVVSLIFVNLLKFISLPLIFLAVTSTLTQAETTAQLKIWGSAVLKYTLITTLLAACLGLSLFLVIDPVYSVQALADGVPGALPVQGSYWEYLLASIPSNLITPFSEGNVVAILIVALLMSFAIMALPEAQKSELSRLFSNLFAAMLSLAKIILKFIPLAIWAFATEFMVDFNPGKELPALGLYLSCVVLANIIQAMVVLPLLLKFKGLSPLKIVKAMAPALTVAFWSKSSAATLPVTLQCAQERLGVPSRIANFSLPLCTTINMNGCAGFIIITVLFVSMSQGVHFSVIELLGWTLIATLTAIGNAGVPMGCYFLSLALLTSMDVKLDLMFIILPFYAFIDMLETAINVWSDACVTACVAEDLQERGDV